MGLSAIPTSDIRISSKVNLKDIIETGKLQLFKGTRINVYRTIVKDYLSARFYLRFFKYLNTTKLIENIENKKLKFMISSVISAHVSNFLIPFFLTPFDVAKTLSMCEIKPKKTAFYPTFFKMISYMSVREGFGAIFIGGAYGLMNSFVNSVLMMMTSHFLANEEGFDVKQFLVLNGVVSSICYPLDTVT